MPAMRSTICIGSAYWRLNACQRDAFFASANVFVPNFARRASASADVSPPSMVTPWAASAASGSSACHAGEADVAWADPADGPVGVVMASSPSSSSSRHLGGGLRRGISTRSTRHALVHRSQGARV